jgi:hypothetical protein
MDEQFEEQVGAQIRALFDQSATMGVASSHYRQSNPHFVDEDDKFAVKEARFQWKELKTDLIHGISCKPPWFEIFFYKG